MMKQLFLFLLILVSCQGFSYNLKLKPGYWHTSFAINDSTTLPVTFLVEKEKKTYHVFVINADETIELRNIGQTRDSLYVRFPGFGSELKCRIVNKKQIEGYWFNIAKGPNYKIPLTATLGYKSRFHKAESDLSVAGRWEVTFDYENAPEKAIGEFAPLTTHYSYSQTNVIKGTFLTETGDYRFLEGVISNDSLNLSTFDGSHAFLFQSKFRNDTLWGQFYSGTHYHVNWYAVRNPDFQLKHPDSLTYLINEQPLKLALPDLNSETYHYPNAQTKNKVTLIQIMGTWCPNCLDESRYLNQKKETFGNQLNIISVAFEMPKTLEAKIAKVQSFKDDLGLDFKFLIGGKASKLEALELFPMLNKVISFPTLIFIDKAGTIRKIHTGFNGPGTGQYYKAFVERTDSFLEALIAENVN